MNAIIYARVSSKEQEDSGYSLDSQEKLLKDYAHVKSFSVRKLFRISESASGKQIRKTFNEMLQYATKNGINIILCEKIDRLTRNLKDAALVNDWIQENNNREIHFVKENFVVNRNTKAHENLVWDMKVAIARFYTNNLSEEVKKGLTEKLRQGHAPRRAIAGYKTIGEQGHKVHVVDESTAPFIRRIFEKYATGNYSMKNLIEEVYSDGFRSFFGKKPAKSRIEDILSNPYYYGAIPWKKELHAGVHEPLISKELFDKVQQIRLRKDTPKYQRHQMRFRKLLKCGECGGTITGEIQKGHVYYHCNHYRNCTQKKFTREEQIEERLLGVFKFFENITPDEAEQIKAKIKQNHAQEIEYKETAITSLTARYSLIQRRIDALYDDRLDGGITKETWERKSKEFVDQQTEIQEQLTKLKSEEAKYFEIWLNILDLARKAKEIYQKRDPEQRRILLAHIFSNLVLKDGVTAYTLRSSVQRIAERVQQKLDTEKDFRTVKKVAKKGQSDSFDFLHPALLRV